MLALMLSWRVQGAWVSTDFGAAGFGLALALGFALAACGSGASADDDSSRGGRGGSTGSSGSSGSSGSANDGPPDCGFTPVTATRLPGEEVYTVRVVNGTVYYATVKGGLAKVALGSQAPSGQVVMEANSDWIYLSDTQIGTFVAGTYPAGNLVLFPLAGGDPITQPAASGTLMGDYRYAGKSQTLVGNTGFFPFTYFRHDVATGQEQEVVTALKSKGVDDMIVGPNAFYVNLSGYEDTDPSDLYRFDKNGGDPVAMTTGIPVQFEVLGLDASYIYLFVDGQDSVAMYGPGLYQMPITGPGPAVRVPLTLKNVFLFTLFGTDAGTFIENYDGISQRLYRVGPSASDAAKPVKLLEDTACEFETLWSTGNSVYGVVALTDENAWLYELPLAPIP